MSGEIRIGISGWRYTPWRGSFYPKGLIQRLELRFASRAVTSIEINGSFYALQTPERYANWYADTPDDFIFSVKAPKFITHERRLRDIEEPMANFMASGLFQLKEKLGPILWQFPPSFKYDEALFRDFLQLLPQDGKAAKQRASQHDPERFVNGSVDIPAKQPLRHTIEIRHDSFVNEGFIELLREFKAALVVADTAGRWPYMEDITSDFVYMRLHGDTELYRSGYSPEALARWQSRISAWSRGQQPHDARVIATAPPTLPARDVYCYFDNTDKLWAPRDARDLLKNLGLMDHLEPDLEKLAGAIAHDDKI